MIKINYFSSLQFLTLTTLLLSVSGCAGYRGGWESVALIGESAPGQPMTQDAGTQRPLKLPGVELKVSIDNQLRTNDTKVYLFALPLSIDPRDVYTKNINPGKTRVFVTATPSETGFVFRPSLAVLSYAGKHISGFAGFEFGMWNPAGELVYEGGTWDHRKIESELILSEPGRKYYLSIDFDTPVPSPELNDITIDLSRALVSARYPALPVIRFMPVQWKEGYT